MGTTKDQQPPLTAEEHSLFHGILVEAAPDSALARHAKRQRRELPAPSAAASEDYDLFHQLCIALVVRCTLCPVVQQVMIII